MFSLDPRLQQDTHWVGDFDLSHVLLMNDARYPWLILVPQVPDVTEWIDLSSQQREQLCQESLRVSERMKARWPAGKLNIGALGNVVAQLHIHHISRNASDPAWPGPVWGHSPAEPHAEEELELVLSQWRADLGFVV